MISDVLNEASGKIEEYLEGDAYHGSLVAEVLPSLLRALAEALGRRDCEIDEPMIATEMDKLGLLIAANLRLGYAARDRKAELRQTLVRLLEAQGVDAHDEAMEAAVRGDPEVAVAFLVTRLAK
jgi:hypothetical protein